ncbi:MAG: TerC family protein [Polyangiaceae bacterium]|nr:TerC family protein [Polyangiaceae bacterium]
MTDLLSLSSLGTLVSLTALEIVLGIDNIIFLSILVARVPRPRQAIARRLGLVLALGTRVVLLLMLSWLTGMTRPLFEVLGHGVSARDLVLIVGGGFLVAKSTWEIFSGLEGQHDGASDEEKMSRPGAGAAFAFILVQIAVMDVVFSLDSVITAVGLTSKVPVMVASMVCAMLVMLIFAGWIGDFVERHPSMKILALSFLILIGTMLVAEGTGTHVPKAYVYVSMAFATVMELLNMWLRRRSASVRPLHVRGQVPEASALDELRRELSARDERIAELEARLSAKG